MPALSARAVHVTDQVLAVLAEQWPLPASTGTVEDRTGYGIRHGQLTYRMLERLARRGEVEKIAMPGMRSRYWRLARRAVTGPDEAVLAALDPDVTP